MGASNSTVPTSTKKDKIARDEGSEEEHDSEHDEHESSRRKKVTVESVVMSDLESE